MEGIKAEDGMEAPLRWAHIDIAGTMEVCSPPDAHNCFEIDHLWCLVGYKAHTVLGEGDDRSSCPVSWFRVSRYYSGF